VGNPSPFVLHKPGESIELQEVFLYFLDKFAPLPIPRSIAEALISDEDVRGLSQWFSALYGKPRNWCDRDWQEELTEGQTASSREMFGALFLIMSSELCRNECGEDSVWPKVSEVLRSDSLTFPTLFLGNHPTQACKAAIAAGARRLKLRNLIDRYGMQEYFDTVKLQFGFTLRGARTRLPEWLDGLGAPVAVKILRGLEDDYVDLASNSFQRTWSAMYEFRRGRLTRELARMALDGSPWIRRSWTSEILDLLSHETSRTIGTASDVAANPNDAVSEILLRWDSNSNPRLLIRLDEASIQELLADANVGIFTVDGKVVARWTAQSSNSWLGPRTISCEPDTLQNRPNLRPKLLLLTTDEGRSVAEISLQEIGCADPLMLFDLNTGSRVSLRAILELKKQYAMLCDSDFEVQGSDKFVFLPQCSVHRLISPISRNLRVSSQGGTYWQPMTQEAAARPSFSVALESTSKLTTEIDSSTAVAITGLPEDTESASLIVGIVRYEVLKVGTTWQTQKPVPITLKLAIGEEKVRVRFSLPGASHSVTPQIHLKLTGIATFETGSSEDRDFKWSVVKRNRPLNLGAAANRARVFVPFDQATLYEGARYVGKVTSKTLPFRELLGWGSPLLAHSAGEPELSMVASIEDRGCVGLYLQNLLGKPINKLYLQKPIQPSRNHAVLVWRSLEAAPTKVVGTDVRYEQDGFVWNLPDMGKVTAIAVSYNGSWLGSVTYANLALWSLNRHPSARVFALLRWLKLPVLNHDLRVHIQREVSRDPAEFVNGWLRAERLGLGLGLVFRNPDPGYDATMRWFLWNLVETRIQRLDSIANSAVSDHPSTEPESFVSRLLALCDLSPALAYNFAKAKPRDEKYSNLIRSVVAQMFRHPPTTTLPLLTASERGLRQQCAELVQKEPGLLRLAIEEFKRHLDQSPSSYKEHDPLLRRLGELSLGRQQISGSLLLCLLEGRTS
jgi:hypothetical protein